LKNMHGRSAFTTTRSADPVTWHQRLGHPSHGSLASLSKMCDFQLTKEALDCCDVCYREEQTRTSFTLSNTRASKPFGLIHCDLWGKYHTPSLSGCHYFLCIVDDFSRATWVYLLQDKIEAYERTVQFCCMVKTQFWTHVQKVRSDNGTEFTNGKLQEYFLKWGILHETSCVDTPQQNGRVERKNRHLLNIARALLFQASLPVRFWGEYVLTATYLINYTPTKLHKLKSPYKILFG